jgi:hypothetical protein
MLFDLHERDDTFRGGRAITITNKQGEQETWFFSVTTRRDGTIEGINYVTPDKRAFFTKHNIGSGYGNPTVEITTSEPARTIRVTVFVKEEGKYTPVSGRMFGDISIFEDNS